MRCFTHQDKEAVGVCKGCNKGICPECVSDLGHSVACKSSQCEEKARLLQSSVERSTAFLKSTKRLPRVVPALLVGMGLAFIYSSTQEHGADLVLPMGLAILISGIIYFFLPRKFSPDSSKKES